MQLTKASILTFIRRCQLVYQHEHEATSVCEKSINNNNQSSIFWDLCKFWVHSKCNHWNFLDFQHIKTCTKPWFCFKYVIDIFPSPTLNNQNFTYKYRRVCKFKATSNLSLLLNQFSDLSSDFINKNAENIINCKYYGIDGRKKLKLNQTLQLSYYFILVHVLSTKIVLTQSIL